MVSRASRREEREGKEEGSMSKGFNPPIFLALCLEEHGGEEHLTLSKLLCHLGGGEARGCVGGLVV